MMRPTNCWASHAGHSVGEYAALVCSGAMRFEDGLSLIRRRGQLMQKVSDDMGDGGMLARRLCL